MPVQISVADFQSDNGKTGRLTIWKRVCKALNKVNNVETEGSVTGRGIGLNKLCFTSGKNERIGIFELCHSSQRFVKYNLSTFPRWS